MKQPNGKGDAEEGRGWTSLDYNSGEYGGVEGEIEVVALLMSPVRPCDQEVRVPVDVTGSPRAQPQESVNKKEGNTDNYQLIPGLDTPYSPPPSPPASPMPYECGVTTSQSLFPDHIYGLDTPLSPSKLSQ